MTQISLPPNLNAKGVALVSEFAELAAHYFSDGVPADKVNTYNKPEKTPWSKSYTPRSNSGPKVALPEGKGPFGDCPDCGVGKVMRAQRKNPKPNQPADYLTCSDKKWPAGDSCQWALWNYKDQADFFASKGGGEDSSSSHSPAAPVVQAAVISPSPPPANSDPVFRSNAALDTLNSLPAEARKAALTEAGWIKGSYAAFVENLAQTGKLDVLEAVLAS